MTPTLKRTLPLALACLCAACPEQKPAEPAPPPRTAAAEPAAVDAGVKRVPEEISITSKSPEAIAAFKQGRALVEGARVAEGVTLLRKAVDLDKKFPLALAYLGFFTPGPEGEALVERASSLSTELPKAERLYVDHLLTWRQGDVSTLYAQRKRLLELAPDDWRVHFELGTAAALERNWPAAEQALRTAIELNPNAAAAQSELAYALMSQQKFDLAIQELTRYAAAHKEDPTTLDTLAEAQLRGGKLDDADINFRAAGERGFWQAWMGVATVAFLKADWAAGQKALQQGLKIAPRPADKLDVAVFSVWGHLAAGDAKGATVAVKEVEKLAKNSRDGQRFAEVEVLRAAIAAEGGQPAQVLPRVASALDRARVTRLAGDPLAAVYRQAFIWKVVAETRLKKLKDAEKSVAFLVKTATISPGPQSESAKSFTAGLVSLAKGEKEAALRQLSECLEDDFLCRLELARTQGPGGAALAPLLAANRRDALYVYARSAAAKLPK